MRKKKINRPVGNEKKELAPRWQEGAVKEKVETILIFSLFKNKTNKNQLWNTFFSYSKER